MSTDTETRTEMLPCPFCGCDDIGTEKTATDGSVWCRGCRVKFTKRHRHPRMDTGQEDAIAAWNTRSRPTGAVSEPVAWLRDAQPDAEDAALVVCAKGDPGSVAVYLSPPSLTEARKGAIEGAIDEIASLIPDDADRADDTDNQAGYRNAVEQVLQILAAALSQQGEPTP